MHSHCHARVIECTTRLAAPIPDVVGIAGIANRLRQLLLQLLHPAVCTCATIRGRKSAQASADSSVMIKARTQTLLQSMAANAYNAPILYLCFISGTQLEDVRKSNVSNPCVQIAVHAMMRSAHSQCETSPERLIPHTNTPHVGEESNYLGPSLCDFFTCHRAELRARTSQCMDLSAVCSCSPVLRLVPLLLGRPRLHLNLKVLQPGLRLRRVACSGHVTQQNCIGQRYAFYKVCLSSINRNPSK